MPRTKKRVTELRGILCSDYGYDSDVVKEMSEEELEETFEACQEASETFEEVQEIKEEASKDTKKAPDIWDAEWTDYVLDMLDENEKENGHPKTDALRRVATKLFGGFDIVTQVVQTPDTDNSARATVVTTVNINGHNTSGAADVFTGNTASKFGKHPVATAETRSEGRALRKALRLVKVLSAEELTDSDTDEPDGSDDRIISGLANSLNLMCDRLDVDLNKLAKHLGIEVEATEELTQAQGMIIAKELSDYQRKVKEVPADVKS